MSRFLDAIEILSFVLLLVLVGYAIGAGALSGNALAIVIIVIAVLSPSPYRIYLKFKDWLEIHRNGLRTRHQTQHPQSEHQTHQPQDDEAVPLPEVEASPNELPQNGS
jgi:hypothetical protein